MIDEPVPTMPLRVPATSPTARTKRRFKSRRLRDPGVAFVDISNKRVLRKLNPYLKAARPANIDGDRPQESMVTPGAVLSRGPSCECRHGLRLCGASYRTMPRLAGRTLRRVRDTREFALADVC